jgi:hypothetical protein
MQDTVRELSPNIPSIMSNTQTAEVKKVVAQVLGFFLLVLGGGGGGGGVNPPVLVLKGLAL